MTPTALLGPLQSLWTLFESLVAYQEEHLGLKLLSLCFPPPFSRNVVSSCPSPLYLDGVIHEQPLITATTILGKLIHW